jgi:hypothetical protein
MSSISTLLIRNLQDVFGEGDPARRRATIDEIFTEDGVFYDPTSGAHRGRDAIDRVAAAVRATHPDFRYQPIAEEERRRKGDILLFHFHRDASQQLVKNRRGGSIK